MIRISKECKLADRAVIYSNGLQMINFWAFMLQMDLKSALLIFRTSYILSIINLNTRTVADNSNL
jgi:hypothetical protein